MDQTVTVGMLLIGLVVIVLVGAVFYFWRH